MREPPAQPSGSLREGFAFQHHVLLTSAFRAAIGVEETGTPHRNGWLAIRVIKREQRYDAPLAQISEETQLILGANLITNLNSVGHCNLCRSRPSVFRHDSVRLLHWCTRPRFF
jgi:hypothetical protein